MMVIIWVSVTQEPAIQELMPHVCPINRRLTKNFNDSHFNALIIVLQPLLFTS